MRYAISGLFFCLALLSLGAGPASPTDPPEVNVLFSPRGGCTDCVVDAIGGAKKSVWIQAYVLTSDPIAKAIANAKQAGLDVRVLIDDQGAKSNGSDALWLRSQGVPVAFDRAHAIAHNKVVIVDDEVVLTGSFNFTAQAEGQNAENLVVIRHGPTAAKFSANFLTHQSHSVNWLANQPSKSQSCPGGNCPTYSKAKYSRRN